MTPKSTPNRILAAVLFSSAAAGTAFAALTQSGSARGQSRAMPSRAILPSSAQGVAVNDTLPTALQYSWSTTTQGACAYNATTRGVMCQLGSLAAGQFGRLR